MRDEDDSAWVAAWRADDQDAFRILVERYGRAVYNLAYRMCGQAATAEDIAQETFIRAHQRQHQFDASRSFKNWVLGICANLTRSRYRWWQRRRVLEEAYARSAELERETAMGATEPSARLGVLEQALSRLPETLRLPLVLKYMEDMAVQDIADTLGIGISAVKMRLSRGREQMLRLMQTTGDKGDRYE